MAPAAATLVPTDIGTRPDSRFYSIWHMIHNIGKSGILAREDLTGNAKTLLFYLWNFADPAGHCRPSAATLQAHLGMAPRTFTRALEQLEKVGLVEVKRYRNVPTDYQLTLPARTDAKITPIDRGRGGRVADRAGQKSTPDRPKSTPTPAKTADHALEPKDLTEQQQHARATRDAEASGGVVVALGEVLTSEEGTPPAPSVPVAIVVGRESAEGPPSEDLPEAGLEDDLVRRLASVGISAARVAKFGRDRVFTVMQDFDVELAAARASKGGKRAPGAGWVIEALENNWKTRSELRLKLEYAPKPEPAPRPTEATRWGRRKADGKLHRITPAPMCALADDGIESFDVPQESYGEWIWLAGEDLVDADATAVETIASTMGRRRLANAANLLAQKRKWGIVSEETVRQVLERFQVTADDLQVFEAERGRGATPTP